jgi:O-antigen ligase
MWDTANQYVSNAVNGGLLSLILFIAILVYGFRYLGNARRTATDKNQALFFWSLAVALFVHVVSFFGISYWDQSIVGWYALLAFISATAVPQKMNASLPQFRPRLELATGSPVVARANPRTSLQSWHTKG